jgi:hypothetical protein
MTRSKQTPPDVAGVTPADERAAVRYERQAARSKVIALRHTRFGVDAVARGDEWRWRFERAQAKLAWAAVCLDLERARGMRRRNELEAEGAR